MSNPMLLFVDACISVHEPSRTKLLADAFLEQYCCKNPDTVVERVDVRAPQLAPLDEETMIRRDELIKKGETEHPMFNFARQMARADAVLVAAPYWDLSFPSQLKVYVENMMANTIVFHYTEKGQEGLCKAKKLYYLTTAGGYLEDRNDGYTYMKDVAALIGITDAVALSAEGLDIWGTDVEAVLEETIRKIPDIL